MATYMMGGKLHLVCRKGFSFDCTFLADCRYLRNFSKATILHIDGIFSAIGICNSRVNDPPYNFSTESNKDFLESVSLNEYNKSGLPTFSVKNLYISHEPSPLDILRPHLIAASLREIRTQNRASLCKTKRNHLQNWTWKNICKVIYTPVVLYCIYSSPTNFTQLHTTIAKISTSTCRKGEETTIGNLARLCDLRKTQLRTKNLEFVEKLYFSLFRRTSSGQNYTLNLMNATWKCDNRRTSEWKKWNQRQLFHFQFKDCNFAPLEGNYFLKFNAYSFCN